MLSEATPIVTLATADQSRAKKFYEDTLGLSPQREEAGGIFYRCGQGTIFVYESSYAGTNKATAVTFTVPEDQFDAEVDALRKKGITFMTFEFEGMTWKDDVATMEDDGGGMRAVWFTDPDNNILNVSTGEV